MRKVVIPKDELEKLYFGQQFSLRDLCRHYNHDLKTILKVFREHGIRLRDGREAWAVRHERLFRNATSDFLRTEYSVKRQSLVDVAKACGLCKRTLRKRLVALGIPIHTKSEAMRGKPKSEAHRLKILAVPRPTKDTSIERLVEDELARREVGHYKHFPVLGVCQADKAFPDAKVAVFCDGDYWHTLPKAVVKDARVNSLLEANGWRVLRFWESEIKKNPEEVVDKICIELIRRNANGCSSAQVEKECCRPSIEDVRPFRATCAGSGLRSAGADSSARSSAESASSKPVV